MKAEYVIGCAVAGLLVIGLVVLYGFYASPMPKQQFLNNTVKAAFAPREVYKEIASPAGFVNTGKNADGTDKAISIGALVGEKVILIDFLTYSCINCQRTFPYLNAWYEKYKEQGLEIVGIHTPEFAFEKDINNVRKAMEDFGITHPIVLDNDYATWRAYGNQYWPRKYLIDIRGNIVYDHIGEGGYEETEMKIRELLAERAKVLGEDMPAGGGLAAPAIPEKGNAAKSPETYFGSLRNEYLANGTPGRRGEQEFTVPGNFSQNALYLGGVWNIMSEYAEAVSAASVVYKYNAKEVYLVADADTPISVKVFQDGEPVGAGRGEDVNAEGVAIMKESRLYKIIRNTTPGEHLLELRIEGKYLRLYAFTFG
ncbi:MAG: redoxin family protein [bacterium]|nr:redoxin family protein [bacterium]